MTQKKINVEPGTHARLREAAKKEGVSIQVLATHLVDYALNQLEAGVLRVRPPRIEVAGRDAA